MNIKSKKSQDFLTSTIIFVIINAAFFALMLLFIARAGTDAEMIEKREARKIALAIDGLEEGTELFLDVREIYSVAEKNGFSGIPVNIDSSSGYVNIQVARGSGNGYYFFTQIEEGSVSLDESQRVLKIKV